MQKENYFDVPTPKRRSTSKSKDRESYPYYAGYAESFAKDAIQRLSSPGEVIFDPWNGAGTTTHVAATMGRQAFGIDLNPVMVIVAKAKCASTEDIREAKATFNALSVQKITNHRKADALVQWIGPRPAAFVRNIVATTISVTERQPTGLNLRAISLAVSSASPATCFLLLAIFRAVKEGAAKTNSSNPTWTKCSLPPEKWDSIPLWRGKISAQLNRLEGIHMHMPNLDSTKTGLINIECASSEAVPLKSRSIDVVLTSPPYCTRIDYAVATLIELAVLGLTTDQVNATLRKDLLGTTSIRSLLPERLDGWGDTCNILLDQIFDHPTTGSRSYYYKNFLQYFDSLYRSISELARIVKIGGTVCSVLQGSHYKECPIDLPRIFAEMANYQGFVLTELASFDVTQNFGAVNKKSRKYRGKITATEQVLVLQRRSDK